ncbi:GH36 C-terminal domain-containing protein [Streptomyces sp. NPDC019507]|uniref:GH36 C-terminal domain-containing protein n=1 Tax=Streptomyces sp. NPDC019507 TaxID=3154689 RepID=UPI0033E32FE0
MQYVRGDETAVLVWPPSRRYDERPPRLRPRGLAPAAECARQETGRRHRGAVLLHHGLHTGLRGDLDAGALRCRRV